MARGVCALDECARPHYGLGWCKLHHRRLIEGRPMRGPLKSAPWIPIKTSASAHKRVKRLWGKASSYPCIACSRTAASWAYDGTDPTEMYAAVGTGTRSYSPDGEKYWSYFSSYPEFYMPMCGSCHSRRGGRKAREELREYRQWMVKTGLRITDLPDCPKGFVSWEQFVAVTPGGNTVGRGCE